MTMGAALKLMWVGLAVLVVLFGLCTIFTLVVTVAEAWQEHAQARWPEVTARVDRCNLQRTSTGRRQHFYIRCRLSYTVGGFEQNATDVYSASVPGPEVSQYPPNQIAPFEEWVTQHPEGTPILVRYNPVHHEKIVLSANNMPSGGPRTPNNVKLLGFFAGGFVILLMIARITRPQSILQNKYSSMPVRP